MKCKTLLMILSSTILVGCGSCERARTHYTGELTYKCSKNGFEYVQSDSGLALHLANNHTAARYNPEED